MSTISLRLPDSLHRMVRGLARKENTSINHLVAMALAEKLSALETEDYILLRAKRASRTGFAKAMAKVADIEPDEYDRL